MVYLSFLYPLSYDGQNLWHEWLYIYQGNTSTPKKKLVLLLSLRQNILKIEFNASVKLDTIYYCHYDYALVVIRRRKIWYPLK